METWVLSLQSTTAAVRFDQTRDPNIPETYYKHKEKQKAFRVETGEMVSDEYNYSLCGHVA